jgi:hypothetical protein
MEPTRTITDEEVEAFQRDGVVPLRAVLPLDWVDEMRTVMDAVFNRDKNLGSDDYLAGKSDEGVRIDMVQGAKAMLDMVDDPTKIQLQDGQPPEGRSIVETDVCGWHEGIRDLYINGPLGAIAARLTNSSKVNLFNDQLFLKEPGSSVRTPWHQDQPYWSIQGTKVAVCWVPVDTVRVDNGAMGYVRGSHLWGETFKPSDFLTTDGVLALPGMDTDALPPLPPIDANPDDYDIVRFEAEPGDVIVHDYRTLHGSTGNISADRLRRANSVRLAGDDVTFYQRPSSPDPWKFTLGLENGDPLDEALERFPRVFS